MQLRLVFKRRNSLWDTRFSSVRSCQTRSSIVVVLRCCFRRRSLIVENVFSAMLSCCHIAVGVLQWSGSDCVDWTRLHSIGVCTFLRFVLERFILCWTTSLLQHLDCVFKSVDLWFVHPILLLEGFMQFQNCIFVILFHFFYFVV